MTLPSWWRVAASAAVFNVVWTASVWLAGREQWALGAVIAGVGGAIHIGIGRPSVRLLATMLVVGVVGLAVDLALIEAGVLGFATREPRIAAVVWFAGLWAHFAPSVPVMFGWLRSRLWLSVPLGVIGGPAAYWIASKLGAVSLMQDWSLFAIAAQWGILFPLAAWALTRPRGVFPRRAGGATGNGATR